VAHAQDLATRHGGVALPLTELDRHLGEADIVVSATASREPIVHRKQVADALSKRKHRPMLLLDLAVPRDIASTCHAVRRLPLHRRRPRTCDRRQPPQPPRSRARSRSDHRPADRALRRSAAGQHAPRTAQAPACARQHSRTVALEKARAQLAAGRDPNEVLDLLAHTLVNRLLHAPTVALARSRADRRRRSRARRRQALPAVARGRCRVERRRRRRMIPSLRRKLEALLERREEVERLLSDPSVIGDAERFRDLSREFSQLEPVANALNAEAQARRDLAAAEAMRNDPGTARTRRRGNRHRHRAPGRTGRRTDGAARPARRARRGNLYLEVRAGTGGDEAAIFAGDLYRMYAR
jgi:hypothetical protein